MLHFGLLDNEMHLTLEKLEAQPPLYRLYWSFVKEDDKTSIHILPAFSKDAPLLFYTPA